MLKRFNTKKKDKSRTSQDVSSGHEVGSPAPLTYPEPTYCPFLPGTASPVHQGKGVPQNHNKRKNTGKGGSSDENTPHQSDGSSVSSGGNSLPVGYYDDMYNSPDYNVSLSSVGSDPRTVYQFDMCAYESTLQPMYEAKLPEMKKSGSKPQPQSPPLGPRQGNSVEHLRRPSLPHNMYRTDIQSGSGQGNVYEGKLPGNTSAQYRRASLPQNVYEHDLHSHGNVYEAKLPQITSPGQDNMYEKKFPSGHSPGNIYEAKLPGQNTGQPRRKSVPENVYEPDLKTQGNVYEARLPGNPGAGNVYERKFPVTPGTQNVYEAKLPGNTMLPPGQQSFPENEYEPDPLTLGNIYESQLPGNLGSVVPPVGAQQNVYEAKLPGNISPMLNQEVVSQNVYEAQLPQGATGVGHFGNNRNIHQSPVHGNVYEASLRSSPNSIQQPQTGPQNRRSYYQGSVGTPSGGPQGYYDSTLPQPKTKPRIVAPPPPPSWRRTSIDSQKSEKQGPTTLKVGVRATGHTAVPPPTSQR